MSGFEVKAPIQNESNRSWGTAAITLIVSVGLSAAVVAALQAGTARAGNIPVVWICAMLAFVIQWIAFVPALLGKTERFYDLTGSLSYLSVILCALALSDNPSPRALLIGAMVIVWSGRLGLFLFRRIKNDGHDKRFDGVRDSFPRFLIAWTLQGLWIVLTLPAAWVAITALNQQPFGFLDWIGLLIWILGFTIEVKADAQKRIFRADTKNKGQFIRSGLWSWSRHPNYFGEIVLWVGIAIMASSVMVGWQWVAWISPVFVSILLMKISGVPLLEELADQRWGGQADYEAYKAKTPVLMMLPPRR